ncbi:MAG: NAD(P)H-dependent oxidoreductase [Candidatus Omnitrophica bacterium]|nr:NAD(P)H-dependent oxidoreductase [Candidatus Omnitrophota bacterium]
MENLIIYAHPNPKSFNHAILSSVEARLTQLGKPFAVRDLYSINFNPVLKPEDFAAFHNRKPSADIAEEQTHIQNAKTLIFIHPIWWFNMPAILKGYVDKVFSYGFAYQATDKGIEGMLSDKKVIIFNTTGGSEENYNKFGFKAGITATIDKGTYGFCGIKVDQHIYFHEVPTITNEKRVAMLDEIKQMKF